MNFKTVPSSDMSELALFMQEAKLLPEMARVRQARSLKSALLMLKAGRELLEQGGLESLSVEAVCQAAGTTVGAFYGRFGSKDDFFRTLQRIVLLRSERELDELTQRHGRGEVTPQELLEGVVALMVAAYRGDVGVMRASLQHTNGDMFLPFKQSGEKYRRALAAALAPTVSEETAYAEMKAKFAYQVVIGVLVQATLNNPGPLTLESPQLAGELTRLVTGYLWPGVE